MRTYLAKLSLSSLVLLALAACGSPITPNDTNPSANPSANPSGSPSTAPSSAPSSPPAAGGSFAYIGLNADKVVSGALVQSDKVNDLHFSYTHTFSSEAEIESIQVLKSVDGVITAGIGWSTKAGGLWVLGVEANGKSLNQSYVDSLGSFSGTVKFDFYGSQSGVESYSLADSGAEYTLEIKLKGQETPIRLKDTI